MMRSPDEWAAHPQGRRWRGLPLLEITQDRRVAGRAACRPPRERPLSGIRVLDLTRVIAGPVCGRTLAAHGADVMRITAPHLPGLPQLDIDTGRGKLSAYARPARRRGARAARERCCARRTCSCRATARAPSPRTASRPRRCAEHAARHRRRLAVGLRPRGPVGRAGAASTRWCRTASGINHAEAEAAGVAGAEGAALPRRSTTPPAT